MNKVGLEGMSLNCADKLKVEIKRRNVQNVLFMAKYNI